MSMARAADDDSLMGVFKMGIFIFNLVPYLTLRIVV